ncbi:leucyl aminopeptidase [Patescibacteria group bacterium]|nr:leucyl aminopeptidase [Patescibacteria group bacterium]MCL5091926.1 leucyl aminopeptidase [Patescibacteria group bacterium]
MTRIIISQRSAPPRQGEVKISLVFEGDLSRPPYTSLVLARAKKHAFTGKADQLFMMGNHAGYQLWLFIGMGKRADFSYTKLKQRLADGLRLVRQQRFSRAVVAPDLVIGRDCFALGKNIALAAELVNYRFNKYQNQKGRVDETLVETLEIYFTGLGRQEKKQFADGVTLGEKIAAGVNLTRDLVNEPASHLRPEDLVDQARVIAKTSDGKINMTVLDKSACRKLGMGAFLAVAQGSVRPPRFIILEYNQGQRAPAQKKTICLVGKSIVFDSGGLSLKPSEAMTDMKIDMAGGATVLGLFQVLAQTGDSRHEVIGILPVCENMPSGQAVRPGDVVRAMNGTTIEVLNTDAEGRLTLADGLAYAHKYFRPDAVIDIATLTGACMVALGEEITGLLGNDESLLRQIEAAGQRSGEELWRLPLYQRYAKMLKKSIADLKNVSGSRWGGTITAALFLQEFTAQRAWVHLDIAGPAYNKGKAHGTVAQGGTGWGVEMLFDFINHY